MEEEAEKKRRAAALAKRKQKDEGRKPIEEYGTWDYMYGALDLFSNKRKRCQIHLLRNLIFEIK